ncbi:hypothetical protein Tco_0937308 [Tanacetum coccineum]|uniref:Uncharacterized protein n=1 Tax=Tanacetum coccineum TaxID=301880 RepID=A0ABQ5DFW5_9ASTR
MAGSLNDWFKFNNHEFSPKSHTEFCKNYAVLLKNEIEGPEALNFANFGSMHDGQALQNLKQFGGKNRLRNDSHSPWSVVDDGLTRNSGIGGSMSRVGEGINESMGGMGGGSLARCSMVSNDGRGGGGLVVAGGRHPSREVKLCQLWRGYGRGIVKEDVKKNVQEEPRKKFNSLHHAHPLKLICMNIEKSTQSILTIDPKDDVHYHIDLDNDDIVVFLSSKVKVPNLLIPW